ncbi:unnamed protein product [Nezara viridula]|uniref:Uncharacterized protein n=1 Tax=Nezara viridula TaxID=85310 RepID=A0A9P0MY00_NEZVI|nr:unnamed protein product [Nezara viridula]
MMEERLVARLRHHNPVLTVTEVHVGRVNRSKKNLVIQYLDSLKLNPSVESSPGLETVVSVDITSSTEQDDIFKKLLAFIRNLGIADVSITSEPFDERQPEIESIGSIPAMDSSSKDYTPLNSDDMEELISRDKSESEFELILSRPRRNSSRDLRRLHSDQSSKDVIGSILRVGEGSKPHCSSLTIAQESTRSRDRSSRNLQNKPRHRIKTFWKNAKKIFKRKVNTPKQDIGKLQAMISNDSMKPEEEKTKEKGKPKDFNILRDIKAVNKPNQVSLNTLQKRLEKVSRDVFSMKNKCPGMKLDGPSLDAYTQTLERNPEKADVQDTKTQTIDKNCSSINASIEQCSRTQSIHRHSHSKSLSETSEISAVTESENRMVNRGGQMAPPTLRGMVTNLIPLYPNMPADMKRPVICELKPVGGPFFFRRITPKKPSSNSIATTSCFTTTSSSSTNSNPVKSSSHSTVTISSMSVSSSEERSAENGSEDFKKFTYPRTENQKLSYGIVSMAGISPFEKERLKTTQTVGPLLKATEINTSEVFKLPKVTQTKPKKKKKILSEEPKAPEVATQTFCCTNSTSCTELIPVKSCGTKTENEVQRVDKENSCHLLTKQPTETKEMNSETLVLKCETCQEMLDKPAEKKRKSSGRQKIDRPAKRGLGWGQFPNGNFGFGRGYAPGRVYPIVSLATSFPARDPFNLPATIDKEGDLPCSRICNFFGGRKKALMEELKKQKTELMQMRMVLVAINEELLAECTDPSSEEDVNSDETCQSNDSQAPLKQNKKVTFREPLVNERILSYVKHY